METTLAPLSQRLTRGELRLAIETDELVLLQVLKAYEA